MDSLGQSEDPYYDPKQVDDQIDVSRQLKEQVDVSMQLEDEHDPHRQSGTNMLRQDSW